LTAGGGEKAREVKHQKNPGPNVGLSEPSGVRNPKVYPRESGKKHQEAGNLETRKTISLQSRRR